MEPGVGAEPTSLASGRSEVPFRDALGFWTKLGFINFGGPAGQIAIMHRELVESRRWLSERQFLRALNFTMILPGPEAQQLATYVGWRLHGAWGAIAAGGLFILPGAVLLLVLAWLAAVHGNVPAVAAVLYGVQPIVIAIVLDAVLRIGKRTLHNAVLAAIAAAAFVAIYFVGVPFPVIVLAAALLGVALARKFFRVFEAKGHGHGGAAHGLAESEEGRLPASRIRTGPARIAGILAVFALLWALPFAALLLWVGPDDVLTHLALFFTQVAFVTFGGAYAVLGFVADVAVHGFGWVSAEHMVQGLALAESTPGPLIMVVQFVGFLAAYGLPGGHDPVLHGVAGAAVTTYYTFLPSFLFIFLGAPYIERLADNERLQAGLTAVTAAVVGVILNLAVFFASRVLLPGEARLDVFALGLAVTAFVILRRLKPPVHVLVPAGALVGAAWVLAGLPRFV